MKNKTGKKVAIIIIIVLLVIYFLIGVGIYVGVYKTKVEHTYATTGFVTNVNYETDIVTVEDYNGTLWQFEGCEHWMVDDLCTMLMDSNGTDKILDDRIVSVRYSGNIEGGWQR